MGEGVAITGEGMAIMGGGVAITGGGVVMGSFFTVTFESGLEERSRFDDTNSALVTVGKGSLTGNISGVGVISTFNLFFTTGSLVASAPLLAGLACDGDFFFGCMA